MEQIVYKRAQRYIVRLDLNKCIDYEELYNWRQFVGVFITRLDDTLVFDLGREKEKLIYIPYNWILWMVPYNEENKNEKGENNG